MSGYVERFTAQRKWAATTFGLADAGSGRKAPPLPYPVAQALLDYWSGEGQRVDDQYLRNRSAGGVVGDVLLGNTDPDDWRAAIEHGRQGAVNALFASAGQQLGVPAADQVVAPAFSRPFLDGLSTMAYTMDLVKNALPTAWEYITKLPAAVAWSTKEGLKDLGARALDTELGTLLKWCVGLWLVSLFVGAK